MRYLLSHKKREIMKLKSFIILGLVTFALTSCNEDFNDWASQQGNTQGQAVSFGNGSVSGVDLIDFANIPEGTDSVQVCKITAPTTSDAAYKTKYQIVMGTSTYDISSTGKMSYADLKSYVEATYGKRPTERDITSSIKAILSNGSTASILTSENFIVKTKPVAPIIEDAYYYIGATNGWSTTDQTYKLTNGGGDVYENPIFTAVIKAPYNADGTRADNWFKIAPASAYALSNFWDCKSIVAATENGSSAQSGSFVVGGSGAWDMPATDGAKYYKLEFNMLDQTYKITPLNFAQYMYVAGDGNGWSQIDYMSTSAYDGKYTGYMYLNSQYKLCTQPSWGGPNYGQDFSTDGGAGNMTLSTPGYYKVDADFVGKTIKLTAITTIGLIGDATPGGWSTSTPMTYNQKDRCWETTATVTNGSFKFRANDGWDINWGGTTSALKQGGDNISISAGTYDFKLFAWCDGKAYCEITKK